jgi:hypothetical protein
VFVSRSEPAPPTALNEAVRTVDIEALLLIPMGVISILRECDGVIQQFA